MNKIRAKLIISQDELGNLRKDSQKGPTIRSSIIRNTEHEAIQNEDNYSKMFQEIDRVVESFKKELKSTANQQFLEIRDRKVAVSSPQLHQEALTLDKREIQRWLTKVCSQTFSLAFQQYRNQTMTFNQAKIFCSENILRNISVLSQQHSLSPQSFQAMDKHIKNGILKYMMTKYPMTQSANINKKLNQIVKQIDNYQRIQYDFFYNSSIVFELRESGNYNDLIMKVINAKLKEIDDVETSEDIENHGWSNFKRFEHYFSSLFEKVEDQEWVSNKQAQGGFTTAVKTNHFSKKRFSGDNKNLAEGIIDFIGFEEDKKKLSRKEKQEWEQLQRQKKTHLQKYRQKVKSYTHSLIGRKINQNVLTYRQKQIDSLHLVIKHESILRILTKWCEELWTKFQTKDYYLNNLEEGLKVQRGGNVNTISLQLKQSLCKLMQQQKVKIDSFMNQLAKNNYEMQELLLKKQLENQDCCTYIDPLEKACGVFSLKVVNNLHNYIITYLNRLIHGLMTVSDQWFSINRNVLKAEIWPSPPNLLTLKIGDLLRCKCESKQNQIISIYRHLLKESREHPEEIKIIRLKNRLKQSTNDLLLNVRLFNKLTCQVQLSIQAPKSNFLEHSNHFSHYLYQLKRSVFGPISQLCSIWSSLDQRRKIYQQFLNNASNQNYQGHQCQTTGRPLLRPFQRPFICSLCKVAYSHNYYVTKHVKCENCSYWRCAKCQLEIMDQQQILENVVEHREVLMNCRRLQNSGGRIESLPEYGFCIFKCAKVAKVEYFNMMQLKNRAYLFGLREDKVYQVAEINVPCKLKQFLQNYLIFSLPPWLGKRMIKIDRIKASHQYLLIQYKNQVFRKERESLCLQEQALTDSSCQLIFHEDAKEKQNIKHLDLEENLLTSTRFICQEFPNLKVLQLTGNRIEDFSGIERLQHLQRLFLGHYPLKQGVFPEDICKLAKLQTLHMQNVNLASLPQSMQYLRHLQKLELGINNITIIPDFFECFTEMEQLSMFQNKIQTLSSKIGHLSSLRSLILSDNCLTSVPSSLSLLSNLQKLDLQSNKLQKVAFSFFNLVQLEELNLSNNSIDTISQDLGLLINLKNLDLNHNNLRQLPQNIQWKSLLSLNISHNKLEDLHQSFYSCNNLYKLEISNNRLKVIDEKIANMKLLSSLNLANNQLNSWSEGIGRLQHLVFLSLSYNSISNICESVGNLNRLQFLYASSNKIEAIPSFIRRCASLKQLYLNDNQITCIPQQLAALKNIEQNHLDLSQNPIEKVLCLDFVLGKGDYMTRKLVMEKMKVGPQNEETSHCQDLERIKEASRKRSLRARRPDIGQNSGKRSTSNNK